MATTANGSANGNGIGSANGAGTGLIDRARSSVRRAIRSVIGAATETKQPAKIYPPSPFVRWDFERASDAVATAVDNQRIDPTATGGLGGAAGPQLMPAPGEVRFLPPRRVQSPIAVNRAFYEGDHWQLGSGYIGPHPQPGEEGYGVTMGEIALIFTSQNAIKEVTLRHALGVVGKPFRWAFAPRRALKDSESPTADEQTLIDEATRLMQDWLLARKVPTLLRDAIVTLLLAERSAIALRVPAGLTEKNSAGETIVTAATIEEALGKIWPEHPMPESATVVTDDDTKLEAGIALYEANDDDDDSEDADDATDYASVSFLDRHGITVFRVLSPDADAAEATEASDETAADAQDDSPSDPPGDAPTPADVIEEGRLNLGGRIPMFEMRRAALVTPQVQQAQRAMNFALTMVPRNITTGGFIERLLLDAQMPGTYEKDANGEATGRFIPDVLHIGSGTTNFIEGARYEETNTQGEKVVRHGTPSAVFREPVKPDASLAAVDAHHRSILDEVGQTHVLISASATASARSRVESRLEYLSTLQLTQGEAEAALRFVVETALAMAEAIVGEPGKYTKALRVQAQCRLDTGTISPEERAAIEKSIGVTISQDTAMQLLGVDDIEAEKARMATDPLARAALATAIGNALTALTTPGATLEGAAKLLGLSKQQIDDLLTPETIVATPGTQGNPATPTNNGASNGVTNGSQNPQGGTAGDQAASASNASSATGASGAGGENRGAKQGSSSGSAAGGQ